MGAIFSLIHPDAFNRQINALERVYNQHCLTSDANRTRNAFANWSSPFNGLAVICNRSTPIHRDTSGGPLMFDFLATFGDYDEGRFEVPGLNARFVYNSGTGIVIAGHMFGHGASAVVGERICLAGFIRPEVCRYAYGRTEEEQWVDEGPPHSDWLAHHWRTSISPESKRRLREARAHIPGTHRWSPA